MFCSSLHQNLLPLDGSPVKTGLSSVLERDHSVPCRVERMVFANEDIFTREKLRAALADNYIARRCPLSRIQLHPKEFGSGAGQIFCCSACFFMRHDAIVIARMSIPEIIKRCKTREVCTAALIILVGFASFGLGRLSRLDSMREPVRVEFAGEGRTAATAVIAAVLPAQETGGKVVGSKNGDKYHFPWCAGAERILEANKIWFDSVDEARKAGYTPASNCKGLK
jgi:hypothetical protein